jgi:hypothetical protein
LIPVVRQCTLELRNACVAGLGAAQASIDLINTRRWTWRGNLEDQNLNDLREAVSVLSNALSEFKETRRKDIVGPYATLIRQASSREAQQALPLRSLYLSFVFATDLLLVATSCLRMMTDIQEKMERRRTSRLWAPKGIRLIGNIILLRTSKEDSGFGEDADWDPPDDEDAKYREDHGHPSKAALTEQCFV